jgi:hypothetical protein
MANFKSVQLFEALNNGETKSQGLTIEKAKVDNKVFVDTLPYGEFSLANIAQISNTIKTLAQHIYNNFIPNDRIIPSGSIYKESTNNNVDLIFYKFNNSTEVTNAGTNFNFRKYLITGENLRENIKYHKPKINNSQNYNSNNNFIIPTAPADENYTGRNGTLYGGKGNTAEFLGIQISQNYKEADSNNSSAELKADSDYIILNMSTPFEVNGTPTTNDTSLTYIDDTLNKNTLVISSGGISKSQKSENTFINTVTNAENGGSFTFYSGVTDEGILQTKTVTFSARGLITNISASATDTDIKVINKGSQTFEGLKTFNTGVGLPSDGADGSYIYLS